MASTSSRIRSDVPGSISLAVFFVQPHHLLFAGHDPRFGDRGTIGIDETMVFYIQRCQQLLEVGPRLRPDRSTR
jgi:hypothetical protein